MKLLFSWWVCYSSRYFRFHFTDISEILFNQAISMMCPSYKSFILFQTKLQNATKLKKILQDSKETVIESDLRVRMRPLKDQLVNTINHLQSIFETHVFIAICRVYWDRMGQVSSMQYFIHSPCWNYILCAINCIMSVPLVFILLQQEILSFLENRKENRPWYKGSRVAVSVSSDLFSQQLTPNLFVRSVNRSCFHKAGIICFIYKIS